jgi:hypothetical protein
VGAVDEERMSPAATEYADVELRYASGRVTLVKLTRGRFPSPTRLARYRGRFSARAERKGSTDAVVPFDFPLLAPAEAPDLATQEAERMGARLRQGVTATTTVRVPLYPGTEVINIYDEATKAGRPVCRVELAKAAGQKSPAPGPAPTPTAPPAAPAGAPRQR